MAGQCNGGVMVPQLNFHAYSKIKIILVYLDEERNKENISK